MPSPTELAQFAAETDRSGAFQRQQSAFREAIGGADGLPGTPGRYHLYVSYACPWAHRTIILRELKGLQDALPMTVVDPVRDERGWSFVDADQGDAVRPDPLHGWNYLSAAYTATDPTFAGRVTTPTLWDTETHRVVNNESTDIIRFLNSGFDDVARRPRLDLDPADLRADADEVDALVYDAVNNGVYQAGFATTQAAYEAAYDALFEALDQLETRLAENRYLLGDRMTLSDWRLFVTLVRFDAVYVGHFKCNRNRIADLPNLQGYLRELFQVPGIAATTRMDHIKRHYYVTHPAINPTRIVPKGPSLTLDAPARRDHLPALPLPLGDG